MKHIARKGEDIRIDCPIFGNPAPIIEWRKGEDIIDYSWIRIRTSKRSMKIRNAQEEDTGMYYCKGVNGFGNTQVRVDLIIIGKLVSRTHFTNRIFHFQTEFSIFSGSNLIRFLFCKIYIHS